MQALRDRSSRSQNRFSPSGSLARAVAGLLATVALDVAALADPPPVRCPCIADTSVGTEDPAGPNTSGGGLDRIFAASNRRFALLKFDTSALEGMHATRAVLRLRRIEHLLVRAGISTVAGDWQEGKGDAIAPEPGAACFNYSAYHEEPQQARAWAAAGSDMFSVTFGGGGSRWAPAVPAFDKDSLWYEIEVPPALVQAVAQGLQPGGLCLSDDFGRAQTLPTFWSRESTSPPELIVYGERVAHAAAAAPTAVRTYRDALGLEWIEFEAPHALGFEISVSERAILSDADVATARKLERWAPPAPGEGPRRALISFDRRSTDRFVSVRTVSAATQWSPPVCVELPPAAPAASELTDVRLPRHALPKEIDRPFTMHDGPSLSEDGRWMRTAPATWWNPLEGPITLEAGRNEFLAFQVVLAGGPGTYSVLLSDWQAPGPATPAPQSALFRQHYVQSRLGKEKYAPDALVPITAGEALQLDLLTPAAASQPSSQPIRRRVVQTIWVELYVPHGAPVGLWRTRVLALRDGAALLDVPIELNVVAPTLPDTLQFTVCLDAEQTPAQVAGLGAESPEAWTVLEAYHRLAHRHRTTLAVVPYAALGRIHTDFAPPITFDGGAAQIDWADWDARFGRYFDGAAFRDLPREGVPLALFYLPFHEGWPLPFLPKKAAPRTRLADRYHYRSSWTERLPPRQTNPRSDDYLVWPIETAFTPEYAEHTRQAVSAFAAHVAERCGKSTDFQFILHNQAGDARGSGWWHFDPPLIHDDVLALRHWLRMYAADGERLLRRVTCAHPLIPRDTLDGQVDVTILSPGRGELAATLVAHPERFGTIWVAPSDISPELGWSEVSEWVWSAALAGARGVHVRDALGDAASWDKADDTALLYPGTAGATPRAPLPSLRLKALCRMQQDVEWLEAWVAAEQSRGAPRGYALSAAAQVLMDHTHARLPNWTTALPVVRFPGVVDTVGFEEQRRVLRRAVTR